ncbi:hypothetical protein SEA_LILBEANIE_14 [Gordonia phage Lilbeanie]|uniref:Uncharacterized protein n=1 Tax=Gordonia phage Lilbeanie TaxID=2794947 RepID=A0A7T1KS87_9CAUD|nr:hypothetical protein J1773_gp14 [Gordonia phage Lilbeanie]QPO17092.1 hypothetical protein SEA_LILBEANIE_14 [Gordonia phage Lilbeanie]
MTIVIERPEEHVEVDGIETVGAVCYHAVVRALQFAAVRSPATGRSNGRNLGVPKHLVHTRIVLGEPEIRGAWDTLDLVLTGDTTEYARVCEVYTRHIIAEQIPPSRLVLTRLLAEHARRPVS